MRAIYFFYKLIYNLFLLNKKCAPLLLTPIGVAK